MTTSSMDICGLLHPYLHARLRHHHGCPSAAGYQRMECSCEEGAAPNERLPARALTLAPLAPPVDAHPQAEVWFFGDDGSRQSAVVERDLRAADLCQLLALKRRAARDAHWAIVEHWRRLGLERCLEDHEEVLAVHWEMQRARGRPNDRRFVFRKDLRKYDLFKDPQQCFPADMVALARSEESLGQPRPDYAATIQSLLLGDGECPPIFSQVWVRAAGRPRSWAKAFLLLSGRRLYVSREVQAVAKFLRCQVSGVPVEDEEGDSDSLHVFANLADYNVYTALNAKNQFRAPTEFGLFLRPTGGVGGSTAGGAGGSGGAGGAVGVGGAGGSGAAAAAGEAEERGLRCLACESERARLCWLSAMRLAKYGKQLRENYRAFKNKQAETNGPKEYNSCTVPNESVRSRVAMDFTGSVGRIVEDPREAKAIAAAAEGYSWKRRLRPPSAAALGRLQGQQGQQALQALQALQGLEAGVHVTQPWFHSGMTRDQAAQLVSRHGAVDGVFLVRESRSTPGSFVLTFKCGSKVFHSQIQPVLDPSLDALCYSLDSGVTKFYDLLQLVEFYQLNAGCLPTRLTHYVVQSPSGPIEKTTAHSPGSF